MKYQFRFPEVGRAQGLIGAAGGLGQVDGARMNPPREVARQRLEVFPEPFPWVAVFAEELRGLETSPRTLKTHPVQSLENSQDLVRMRV